MMMIIIIFDCSNMFDFKHIRPFDRSTVDARGPCVLFATPGMLHAGEYVYSLYLYLYLSVSLSVYVHVLCALQERRWMFSRNGRLQRKILSLFPAIVCFD